MKPYARKFYNSDAWHRCRNAYIQKRLLIDGGLCEECHKAQGYIVHHKVYITEKNINNPLITLNEENLLYVCKQCHDSYEGHGIGQYKNRLKVVFDENGMPIDRPHSRT